MGKYIIRDVQQQDYSKIAGIYNSNSSFLLHHLGVPAVTEDFVAQEVLTMRNEGFHSCVIINQENLAVEGILDYKADAEVYLSLLMLSNNLQGKGVGSNIYLQFEREMIQDGKSSIRIDVVNDYHANVVPFWKKQGFLEKENIMLEWGKKKSNAVVMKKNLTMTTRTIIRES